MIESSRFNNRLAWFLGTQDAGDYYDQSNGEYLGSWSRSQANFVDSSKSQQNLFDLDAWKNRDEKPKKKSDGLLSKIAQNITQLLPAKPLFSDPLQLPGEYIAFIGDSFCAGIDYEKNQSFMHPQSPWYKHPRSLFPGPCWPSLVADGMGLNLAPYGFGGRSWWYSWQIFWNDWRHRLKDIAVAVFVHTECRRINHAITNDLPLGVLIDSSFSWPKEKIQAVKYFRAYIEDEDFQRWSQRQFFHHIADVMPDVKMIHYFCFNRPSEKTLATLPGIKFTTPLVCLSAAQYEIDTTLTYFPSDFFIGHKQANHFSAHNNQALASVTLNAIKTLDPGSYAIPWDDFQMARPDIMDTILAKWFKHEI
jgi:hypothetical protein